MIWAIQRQGQISLEALSLLESLWVGFLHLRRGLSAFLTQSDLDPNKNADSMDDIADFWRR